MSQMHLHSKNFDLCRLCLLEPESNRNIKFVHIFTSVIGDLTLRQQYKELLGVEIGSEDVKPKMICENCYKSLSAWYEMKKKATESEKVIEYIAVKKFATTGSKTKLFPLKKGDVNDASKCKNGIKKNSRLITDQKLFTCLKPSCNLIFQSFRVFRSHYREHCKFEKGLMCLQCCKPYKDMKTLKFHQLKEICYTPGMYKCSKCPKQFNDLQSLSIHKYTFHDGILIASKNINKTIECAICNLEINIFDYKYHLITCKKTISN